jgi:hypothetical protein
VRPAPRPADGPEAIDLELVGDRGDVGGAVGHRAPLGTVGPAVARPRVADVPDAALGADVDERRVHPAAGGSPGVAHHDVAVLGPGDVDLEPAAVGGGNDLDPLVRHLRPSRVDRPRVAW